MLKYWRLWLLLIMVLAGILAITLKPQYTGVQIAYVSDISPAKGTLQQGMIISEVNGQKIGSSEEWNAIAKDYQGEIELNVDRKEYEFYVNETLISASI